MQIPRGVRRAYAESPFWFVVSSMVIITVVVVSGFLAIGTVRDTFDGGYDAEACNDGDGNPYIETALVDHLAPGTLRSYMNTGADCDDRRTGSVAAGWGAEIRPRQVVDQLTGDGWARTDPPDGAPEWYATNALAGDPVGRCLTTNYGDWQSPRFDLYPSDNCSLPSSTQVVLTKTVGPRVLVARLNLNGMTVDAAHKDDGDSARLIQRIQLTEPREDD